MDTKTARKILNLDMSATLSDAKKAYRSLAKKYHPDMMGKKYFLKIPAGDEKMKEINLAFCFLAPLLKTEKDALAADSVKPDPGPMPFNSSGPGPQTRGFGVLGVFSLLKALFCLMPEHRAFEGPGKTASARRMPGKKSCFKDVFKQAQKSNVSAKNRIQGGNLEKAAVKNYQTPLAFREKMMSGCFKRNSNRDTGSVGRVEPVARIRPVEKI